MGEVVLPASAVDALLDLVKIDVDRSSERSGAPRAVLQQAARTP